MASVLETRSPSCSNAILVEGTKRRYSASSAPSPTKQSFPTSSNTTNLPPLPTNRLVSHQKRHGSDLSTGAPSSRQHSSSHGDSLNVSKVSFHSPTSSASPRSMFMQDHQIPVLDLDGGGSYYPTEQTDTHEENEEGKRKRREHERTVQSLIDTMRRDLEQERCTVKQLLQAERMNHETLAQLRSEHAKEKRVQQELVDRLFAAREEADRKDRLLQRALGDARAWKQLATVSGDRERALEAELAMADKSNPLQKPATSKRKNTPRAVLSRIFSGSSITSTSSASSSTQSSSSTASKLKLEKLQHLWRRTQDECEGLRRENTELTKVLAGVQTKDSFTKSKAALLEVHEAFVRGMSRTNNDENNNSTNNAAGVGGVQGLEQSLLNSFELDRT